MADQLTPTSLTNVYCIVTINKYESNIATFLLSDLSSLNEMIGSKKSHSSMILILEKRVQMPGIFPYSDTSGRWNEKLYKFKIEYLESNANFWKWSYLRIVSLQWDKVPSKESILKKKQGMRTTSRKQRSTMKMKPLEKLSIIALFNVCHHIGFKGLCTPAPQHSWLAAVLMLSITST